MSVYSARALALGGLVTFAACSGTTSGSETAQDASTAAAALPSGPQTPPSTRDGADANVVGYAVYVKTSDASVGGDGWYWYARVPLDSTAPHDANGVVADGPGTTTNANPICVSCHSAAGKDAAHTPTPGSGDQVDTQVK